MTVADYDPLVISEVFDRNNNKIGEFFRERRTVIPFDKIPKQMVNAFVSAEDSSFFEHGGVNYFAILRAFAANLKAGKKVQGGSTITQQTAKTLLLSSEKTYIRKIKDMLLAHKMEQNLSKQDILYLYLNQIYLGQGAYGIAEAAKVYFRKNLNQLTIGEMAMIAGLPQAPSRYSPVAHPRAAKERQIYVLNRMAEEKYISKDEAKKFIEEPISVYIKKDYDDTIAPYFLETVRQYLVKVLGEDQVLNKGLVIKTPLDMVLQQKAQADVRQGLQELDKRQGYRGATKNLSDTKDIADLLLKTRDSLYDNKVQKRTIFKDGSTDAPGALSLDKKSGQKNIPAYVDLNEIVDGVVVKVDDVTGLVQVRFAEGKGLIDLDTMKWAHKPNLESTTPVPEITKPSEALKVGDVIRVKVVDEIFSSSRLNELIAKQKKLQGKNYQPMELPNFKDFARLELEQEPLVEGSLISFDLASGAVLSLVGGYNFEKSEFNRALQAARQTGSSFKPIVYAAALDSGFAPNSVLMDAPVVFEQKIGDEEGQANIDEVKKWKPGNYESKFGGDILFRNALIRSKNIPTIRILEKVGVERTATYARRLGIFSPLNMDLSLGLGSSGVTLYEMTKAFSVFAVGGKRFRPIFINSVTSAQGQELLSQASLDSRYEKELEQINKNFEEQRLAYLEAKKENNETLVKRTPPFFFDDPDQLISQQTAYLMDSIMTGVVAEPGGTGGAARSLGKILAGKTGTTNGYFDAWFIGFSPQIATGVWVGFDDEKTLGRAETGGRAALPIWINYMQEALKDLPSKPFDVPPNIVFVSIDNDTGKLASASSKNVVRQAFLEGTGPASAKGGESENQESVPQEDDKTDFYKEDLND